MFIKKLQIKQKLIDMFKQDKKTFLFVAIGFACVILIVLSEIDTGDSQNEKNIKSLTTESNEYCTYLEQRVEDVVSSIEGAGKVKVMITIAETTEYVYAQNQNGTKKTNKDSENSDSKSDYVIIEKDNNDSGLLVKTFEPKIRGVAIVCEGGNNPTVQQQIYSTVSAVLNVSTARISISKLASEKE